MFLAPTVSFTAQQHWGKYTVGIEEGRNFFATRFPVVGFAYPLGTDAVVTLTVREANSTRTGPANQGIPLISAERNVGLTDTFLSDGGIVAIQAGCGPPLVEHSLRLASTLGFYRGGLTRGFQPDLRHSAGAIADHRRSHW